LRVFTAVDNARKKQQESAELTARLKISEEHNRQLREENQRLQAVAEENERLKAQNSHYCERNVLLEEEVRWLKAQVFGRTNDKVSSDVSADQQLLFNEAEVLAAIEAADAAHAARKTKIAAHEREHSGGRKAIPKDFPRIRDCQKSCALSRLINEPRTDRRTLPRTALWRRSTRVVASSNFS
jgi:hypothetical protein